MLTAQREELGSQQRNIQLKQSVPLRLSFSLHPSLSFFRADWDLRLVFNHPESYQHSSLTAVMESQRVKSSQKTYTCVSTGSHVKPVFPRIFLPLGFIYSKPHDLGIISLSSCLHKTTIGIRHKWAVLKYITHGFDSYTRFYFCLSHFKSN